MKLICQWDKNLRFVAKGAGHEVAMDAKKPVGDDTAFTPKELVLAALGGCTAMDVAALLKKYKQTPESFDIEVESDTTQGYPSIFKSASLHYVVTGKVEASKLVEAITLSQTKYCGVSAMLTKAMPISYKVTLNNEIIHQGTSQFE